MFEYGYNGLETIAMEYAKYENRCKMEGKKPVGMWAFMRGKY